MGSGSRMSGPRQNGAAMMCHGIAHGRKGKGNKKLLVVCMDKGIISDVLHALIMHQPTRSRVVTGATGSSENQ
jgi:hypothetical protein